MIKTVSKIVKNKKGFTLVELVIVLAILGVIALIAIPRFGTIQEESKRKADIASAAIIGRAAELALANGEQESDINLENLVTKGYLDSVSNPQYKEGTFEVEVENGKVVVKVDTSEVYPNQTGRYSQQSEQQN
ncbi:type IV pilus assembly protein PilA [Alkalithermobacter thermoalcaliphilus JW-YL-7 = DSM 7308]|uniref:Prepilin-type N-terminal cleavage/methylation domain-containing protein n=1 Tax=Alkalithermobacter thermoalcaliphilus JW-YL-7 = DSM 7308 TaxID=1121328 RepID=A0A150FUE0_CLOPD|nr:prepilin-type N-terminal cleavage/methylation domain-containing protein [[Clostridium] paradoxum JW-YL-7 = DSM 7308]SHL37048.1 type IV pilus assembly protein PilA [[Clostridium] paradoxum JW-YL-7 = DSM 7308]